MTQTFSIGCGFVSLIMYFVYVYLSNDGAFNDTKGILFFILLTIRFSLWFFSRVKRASESSGKEQSIAWVEFGYYFGMVLGLVVWKLSGFTISLIAALLLDFILQCCAGLLDIKAFSMKEPNMKGLTNQQIANMKHVNCRHFNGYWGGANGICSCYTYCGNTSDHFSLGSYAIVRSYLVNVGRVLFRCCIICFGL